MPVSFPEDALKEFNVILDELSSTVRFIRAANTLRPQLGGLVAWKDIGREQKALVRNFVDQKFVDITPLFRGLLVTLAGAFEHLVRRLIRDAILAISESTRRFDDIPAKLRNENILRTGKAFVTVNEPPDHLSIEYEIMGKNVGTCFSGSEDFILNADAFSIFITSVSPEHLVQVLSRTGFDLKWDDLGNVNAIRNVTDTRDTRETSKKIQDTLRSFIQNRNRIAHTGSGGVALTAEDIDQLIKFFRVLAAELGKLIRAKLIRR